MSRHPLSSLNLLHGFEAAARLGSFKEAAEELCVTASAVSQQVKALEDQLGVALFERQPRGLVLTEAGRRYAAEIRPHLLAIDEATLRLRDSGRRTRLRITLMPPLASRVVLPGLPRLRARCPEIDLEIDTSVRDLDLQRPQADLAIRYGVPPWPGCVHEKLADLFAQPVCAPAIAEAYDLDRSPENLLHAPLVHIMARPENWSLFFTQLGRGAPRPATELFVDHYPAAMEAAETAGVALALWPLERPLLESGRLIAVGPPLGPLPGAMYAVMIEEKQRDPAVGAFLAWLRDELATLA